MKHVWEYNLTALMAAYRREIEAEGRQGLSARHCNLRNKRHALVSAFVTSIAGTVVGKQRNDKAAPVAATSHCEP